LREEKYKVEGQVKEIKDKKWKKEKKRRNGLIHYFKKKLNVIYQYK
jgi:hypothetical protein